MKEKEFQSNELNNKQLEQVSGGANTNSFNEGPKYKDHQKVRFFPIYFIVTLMGRYYSLNGLLLPVNMSILLISRIRDSYFSEGKKCIPVSAASMFLKKTSITISDSLFGYSY